MTAKPLVCAAILLQTVHRGLAAVLVAADVDDKAVRDGGGKLEGRRGQLAGAEWADLAVHEFLEAAGAEHAETHAVAPPVGHEIGKVLQPAFVAAALDVAHVRERCHQREAHDCRSTEQITLFVSGLFRFKFC